MGIPVELVGQGIDWPAWVQAVGSVLALAALFVAQRLDHVEAKRVRRIDTQAQMARSARGSITAAKFLVASIASAEQAQLLADGKGWTVALIEMQRVDLAAALASVRDIDRGGLPNEAAVVAVVNLIQAGHASDQLMAVLESAVREKRFPKSVPLGPVRDGAEASLAQLRECWIAAGVRAI